MDAATFHDQRPSHNPMTRRQELLHAADVLDIQRCVIVDTDTELSYEKLMAIAYIRGYARFDLCEHATVPQLEGRGDDVIIKHTCTRCGRVISVE